MTACLTHLEEYVKELYLKNGITKPKQLHFQQVSKALGIKVFYWQEESQALFASNQRYIVLNESLSPQQQWQDYCHELGHALLHVGDQGKMQDSFRAYQEMKANQFMYNAAMPTFMLQQLPLKRMSTQQVANLFNVEVEFAAKRLKQYIQNRRDILRWNGHFTAL